MKYILFIITLPVLLGCCDQFTRKNANSDSKRMDSVENDISIKYINQKNGLSNNYENFDAEGVINLITDLLIHSEPVRVHLDEIEMNDLFNDNDLWEFSFAKPFVSENGSLGISKFVYFLSGNYSNDDSANISYFFIATNDGQFIQSPLVAEKNTKKEFEKYLGVKP